MATSIVNLDTTQYVKVNAGFNHLILQAPRDTVRIVFSDVKPAITNQAFHVLGGKDQPLQTVIVDTNVWALALTDTSSLIVTETVVQQTDFLLEVSKGNVPGHRWVPVLTRINASAGNDVIEDWRPTGGVSNILSVTTAETWEIVSDDVNDTAAGTGARTVAIDSLDANYDEQTTLVTMNGTTPVTISGSHIRPRAATVATAGSDLVNAGNITVRKAGETDEAFTRNYIVAGQSLSKDPGFTVPRGKTAFIKQTTIFVPKNEDGIARNKLKAFGIDTPLIIGLDIPFYQNAIVFPVQGPFQLGEKLDIIFQVSTSNPNIELQSIVDFILIDNEYIGVR